MSIVAGIDGGGTKTQVVLLDESAAWVAVGWGGSANVNFSPREVVVASFRSALSQARERLPAPGEPVACVVVSSPTPETIYRPIVDEHLAAREVVRAGEGETGLAAGARQPFGVCIIAGTGSLAFGRSPGGQTVGCGGWGTIIGDEGSGYAIGVGGIQAACRAYDGRGVPTLLVDLLMRRLEMSSFNEIIPFVYRRNTGRRELAALAPVVFDAARQGDAVARGIIRRAGQELALVAATCARRLEMASLEFPVVGAGGVFRGGGDLILPATARYLRASCPLAKLIPARYDPAIGAALIALRRLGHPLDDSFYDRLDRTLATVQSGMGPGSPGSIGSRR